MKGADCMPQNTFWLCEKLPVGVYMCDEEGRLNYYNPAAASIWGIKPELGIAGWGRLWQIYDSSGQPFSLERFAITQIHEKDAFKKKKEITIQLMNGDLKRLLVLTEPILDDTRNVADCINTLIDITDEHENDVEQGTLAAIVNSSDDAIISKTLKGLITSWNHAAEVMFGYTAKEAIGQHIGMIIPPDRLEEERLIISKISAGEKVEHYETLRRHKNGTLIPISLTISPIRNLAGQIVGASNVSRDISKQKLAEERLQSYTAHLEAEVAQRTHSLKESMELLERAKEDMTKAFEKERDLNQLKSRFVSMASHEFRTPLSSVQLSASLIEKYTSSLGNEHVAKHLGKIKASISNLNSILNDFLSLEKLDSGKAEVSLAEFDLPAFIEEITEEMRLLARLGQNIHYHHYGKNRTCKLDAGLLRNCVVNLISNAIKYSGENTLIEVSTVIDDEKCSITVKDNGIGIPQEDQKHLFQAFFRAHNTGTVPGTGLGLNIVVRYVELMKGKIDFESQPDNGSRFALIFPVH